MKNTLKNIVIYLLFLLFFVFLGNVILSALANSYYTNLRDFFDSYQFVSLLVGGIIISNQILILKKIKKDKR